MTTKALPALVATLLLFCAAGPAAAWNYGASTDQMTDAKTVHASMRSKNSLSLPFPYAGPNHGVLFVRQHPKYGLDVIVSVNKGQILCRSYDGCTVSVRFDSAKPAAFSASPSADHGSDTIFIRNSRRFIESARRAKRILVQMTMYQAGEQVLEFESGAPLVWPPPKQK